MEVFLSFVGQEMQPGSIEAKTPNQSFTAAVDDIQSARFNVRPAMSGMI